MPLSCLSIAQTWCTYEAGAGPLDHVALTRRFCHKRALNRPADQGLPWRVISLAQHQARPAGLSRPRQGAKMPKQKTHSGSKKRFKITANGKVKYTQSGKRHGMIKRTTKQIREHRGTKVLFKTDGDNIIKYRLPNG
jgi:large subunit ribosomal protein L35